MNKDQLLHNLKKVEKIARLSKLNRLLYNPLKYLEAILFMKVLYPKSRQERLKKTNVFFGNEMLIALPASTDIYLTGGKSHISEIRLARFIINHLSKGAAFLDIGAHYGYFTLLAEEVSGADGKIVAFEPSPKTFSILKENAEKRKTIQFFQEAVSDSNEPITFYEFPNKYSEYNAMDVAQFNNEDWYQSYKPQKITINARTIDSIIEAYDFKPQIIKIDVEGAEYKVISGAQKYLDAYSPYIVMEYLCSERSNGEHHKALDLLNKLGYASYCIDDTGTLQPVANIDNYLAVLKLESDNIVFRK